MQLCGVRPLALEHFKNHLVHAAVRLQDGGFFAQKTAERPLGQHLRQKIVRLPEGMVYFQNQKPAPVNRGLPEVYKKTVVGTVIHPVFLNTVKVVGFQVVAVILQVVNNCFGQILPFGGQRVLRCDNLLYL